MSVPPDHPALPRLPAALLHRLLPGPERDEVFADLAAEYRLRVAERGEAPARRGLWR